MADDDRSRDGTPAAASSCEVGSGVAGGVAGPTPAAPGVGAQVLAEARWFVLRLQDLPSAMHQLDEQGLAELLQCLLVAGERCESMTALALADAVARGTVVSSTAASPAQLITRLGGGEPVADVLGADKATNNGPLVPLEDCDEAGDGRAGQHGCTAADGASAVAATPDDVHAAAGADVVEQSRVCGLATGVAPGRATGIAKVADSLRSPVQEAVIGEALRQGATSVGCARTALREADRVQPVLPAASRGEVLGWFLNLGPEATPRELKNLGRMIIATFGDQTCLDDQDDKLRTASSLRWSDLPGGLTRFVAELAPTEAAMVKQAIHALSAPNPDHPNATTNNAGAGSGAGAGAGAVDERPVERRRADALVELLHQAAQQWESSTHRAAGGKAPLDKDSVTGRACLVITTDLNTLAAHRRDHNPVAEGSEPMPGCGCGVTLSGDVLPRSTVQLIGCDGGVTVISKNKDGTPAAYGRRDRLFTGALRTLIVDRDRCCTFPGCGRPPDWCQVHHIDPWEAGGHTTYDNGTLLCQRHHTIVHSRQLTADLVEGHIHWDLRRGRMLTPGHQRQAETA